MLDKELSGATKPLVKLEDFHHPTFSEVDARGDQIHEVLHTGVPTDASVQGGAFHEGRHLHSRMARDSRRTRRAPLSRMWMLRSRDPGQGALMSYLDGPDP